MVKERMSDLTPCDFWLRGVVKERVSDLTPCDFWLRGVVKELVSDLTPCDLLLWCMVKERVYSRKILDISNLKVRIWTVISFIPREICVRALNGTVARWFLCVKQDGEQVETVL
jgi:hypothetical protein